MNNLIYCFRRIGAAVCLLFLVVPIVGLSQTTFDEVKPGVVKFVTRYVTYTNDKIESDFIIKFVIDSMGYQRVIFDGGEVPNTIVSNIKESYSGHHKSVMNINGDIPFKILCDPTWYSVRKDSKGNYNYGDQLPTNEERTEIEKHLASKDKGLYKVRAVKRRINDNYFVVVND